MPSLRPSAIGFAGNASDLYTTPYPHGLGDKARDSAGNEYVFVDFNVTGASVGSVVVIDGAHFATPLSQSASQAGRVGVVVAASPTTNQAGWVQVYGFALVQGSTGYSSGAASASDCSDTSTLRAIVPTTVVTSPLGAVALVNVPTDSSVEQSSVEINQIFGMWTVFGAEATNVPGFSGDLSAFPNVVSGAAVTQVSETSGAVTNTTAGIGNHLLPVFLNYPYHLNQDRNISGVVS
jgi:hypothetical protein